MRAIFHHTRSDIDVQISPRFVRPGEKLEAAVTIMPSEKFSVRRGAIELACIETYYKSNSEGPDFKHTGELVRITEPLLTNMEVAAGEVFGGTVQFEVPYDAVPSIFGEVARIVWEVNVRVDVFRGRDLHKTKGFVVRGNPHEESSRGYQVSESNRFNLTLSGLETMIDAGSRVEGRLELQSHKELSVKDVRVELERIEQAQDSKLNKTVLQIDLQGPEKIAANQLLQWPFSFNMPSGALPSVKIDHTGVVWKVKGIADFGLLSDLVVEQEIQVYNSR